MICYLNGVIHQKHLEFVILDVQGVGYEVIVPAGTLCTLPPESAQIQLYISTYIREDAFRLYGFMNMFDKNVFEALLSVSGIGPKVAISLLGAIDGFALCGLIVANQREKLTNIPGIGEKTAERIVLELKNKCQKLMAKYKEQQLFAAAEGQNLRNIERNQAFHGNVLLDDLNSALSNMGYKEKQFSPILESIQRRLQLGEHLIFDEVFKESLKKLSERILKG